MRRSRGFTLIELLVVIGIIGVLAALIIPAVQSAREASRRTHCSNNLKQLAMAALAHHESHRALPTGGWGWAWLGDPDRGYGQKQPGGWIFNCLPFMEEGNLRNLGAGTTDEAAKRSSRAKLVMTPVAGLYCPSRRGVAIYPYVTDYTQKNSDPVEQAARNDYAANSGSVVVAISDPPPKSLVNADAGYRWPETSGFDGVIFLRSATPLGSILDGVSKTYLVGEKWLDAEHYTDGLDLGDDQSAYVGYDTDNVRFAQKMYPPLQDTDPFVPSSPPSDDDFDHRFFSFGGPHVGGFQMAFCDGSVHLIPYEVDLEVHRRLASKSDRQTVNIGDW